MNETIDPRIDKMIAFLYGELPESERRAFERLLERDEALRAEFEELKGTRGLLADWQVEEHAPSFVLVSGREEARAARPAEASGFLEKLIASIRNLGASPAWGLAAAAVVLLVLGAAGFRVERVSGGIAFRFGGDRPASTQPASLPGVGEGRDLALGSGDGSAVTPVSGYVTEDEIDEKNTELLNALMNLLNEYGQRRDQETYTMVQSMYQQLRDEQNRDYRQLTGRMDAIGLELLAARNGVDLDELLKNGAAEVKTENGSGEE